MTNKIRTDIKPGGHVQDRLHAEKSKTGLSVVRPVRLLYNDQLTDGVFLLGFRRDFSFEAGQIIGIAMDAGGPRRLYSICSGEEENEIKILYNVVNDGLLTPGLSDLGEGSTIWITEPRGSFVASPGPAVWIATGTGIAPFYSMMRSGLAEDKLLIHGERYPERFHFHNEFSKVHGDKYIRCCTTKQDESYFPGRVTDFLRETERLDPGLKYYLCGRTEMVVEARDILISRGVPYEHIISEIYF